MLQDEDFDVATERNSQEQQQQQYEEGQEEEIMQVPQYVLSRSVLAERSTGSNMSCIDDDDENMKSQATTDDAMSQEDYFHDTYDHNHSYTDYYPYHNPSETNSHNYNGEDDDDGCDHDQDDVDNFSTTQQHPETTTHLGHSRIATTLLDTNIPTKRPRLDLDLTMSHAHAHNHHDHNDDMLGLKSLSPVQGGGRVASHTSSLDEEGDDDSSTGWSLRPLAPNSNRGNATLDLNQKHSTEISGVINSGSKNNYNDVMINNNSNENNYEDDDDNNNNNKNNNNNSFTSSVAMCPTMAEEEDGDDGSITSHSSNSSIAGSHGVDRWRSHHLMSSFSSTLTERSADDDEIDDTAEDDDDNNNNNNINNKNPRNTSPIVEEAEGGPLSSQRQQQEQQRRMQEQQQQQQQQESSPQEIQIQMPDHLQFSPQEDVVFNTENIANTANNNNNNNNYVHPPQSAVDQLTSRLDHWCSITNMRALQKRRNNIYADDRHKSALYNPQQDYDYSNAKLSRRIRKMQCQSANKEVMRALLVQQQQQQRGAGDSGRAGEISNATSTSTTVSSSGGNTGSNSMDVVMREN